MVKRYGELPLYFEANSGQTASQVKFLSRGPGYGLFLTPTSAVLSLAKPHRNSNGKKQMAHGEPGVASGIARHVSSTADHGQRTTDVVEMRLVGANTRAKVRGEDELPGRSNYFIGNDPKKWRTNVPAYAKVKYEGVYPGVDLIYYGNQGGQLEYDFVVAPGADPSVIAVDVAAGLSRHSSSKNGGVKPPLQVDPSGDLVVKTASGEVRFHKPVVYQEQFTVNRSQMTVQDEKRSSTDNPKSKIQNRKFLDGRYVLQTDNQVGFKVASYDHTIPLVIDPVLSYATYFGGTTGNEQGNGIAVDAAGNVYVTGSTTSTDFPTTTGAFQTTLPYGGAFVAKLNPGASGAASLVYSTYLGGHTGSANGAGIAVDSSGNAYVTGTTGATDFPTTSGAFRTTAPANGGGADFVAKLNAAGSALIYSTYLGGNAGGEPDQALGIAVDPGGNACVTGFAVSLDFPTTPGAFQATFGGGSSDVFVTKLNATGSALLYSTYLGGSGSDGETLQWFEGAVLANGIAVDSSGNIYVTGATDSPNFPTTVGAFQPALSGSFGSYLAKINPSASGAASLVYSTYLSGGTTNAIAVDSAGNAYVTGLVGGPGSGTYFPITPGAFQTVFAGTIGNAFVAKLNAAGSALAYSTYLGGSGTAGTGEAAGNSITVDAAGDAFVGGSTYNQTDFPTVNPVEAASDLGNAFVTEFNPAGTALLFSTTLGGPVSFAKSNGTHGFAIAVDLAGNIYLTGLTQTDLFPTVNAFQSTCEGCDYPTLLHHAFVLKISSGATLGVDVAPANLPFGNQAVGTTSVAQTVTLSNNRSSPLAVTSIVASGDFAPSDTCGTSLPAGADCSISVTFTPTAAGSRSGTLTLTDSDSSSPQTVSLTGMGVASATSVTLSAGSLTFAAEPVGTASSAQTVTLNNTGNTALTITSIAASGDYAETNNCGSSVAAGAHCTFTVTFTPTVGGSRTGNITITDNAAGLPQTVTLTGTGEDFSMAAAGTPTSATLTPGQAFNFTLSIAPTGGLTGPISFTCAGAPSEATCTVSPASATISGDSAAIVTVNVTTTAASVSVPRSRPLPPVPPLSPGLRGLLMLALVLAAMSWTMGRRNRPGVSRWQSIIFPLALGFLLALGLAGCGGGGGGGGGSSTAASNPGTPAGTYTLTVTGTMGSGSSALSHDLTLTLTVS
jgi:hypothetical protein